MPAFIDSHVHLADPAFAADVEDVIARARVTGAHAMICIGESPEAADRARALVERHPGTIWHTAGVHPHDAEHFDPARDLPALREHLERGAVAVGECGLDYFYDNAPRDAQRRCLAAQVALAAETRRPLVVHTRQAEADTNAMLRDAESARVRGVLHCFTGPAALAEQALGAGWCISFSGVVTFKKWTDDALIRQIPPDRLLVESDAPYLSPVPHRGKRNEPAYVSLTLARVAQARGMSAEDLGAITIENAVRLFGLASIAPPA
jgi:TatD DNase family protein